MINFTSQCLLKYYLTAISKARVAFIANFIYDAAEVNNTAKCWQLKIVLVMHLSIFNGLQINLVLVNVIKDGNIHDCIIF